MMNSIHVQTLAALVAALRPEWGEQGIRASLLKVQAREPFDVAVAAINACRVPSNRTPAVIAMPGEHWAEATVASPSVPREDVIRRRREESEARRRDAERARESRLAARRACAECGDDGRLPDGSWCGHDAVVGDES